MKLNYVQNDVLTLEELRAFISGTALKNAPESFVLQVLKEMEKHKLLQLFGDGDDFGIKVF